jgi:hypothetical protein
MPGAKPLSIDEELRAAPVEGIADIIIPARPIRSLGFGAIVGLNNQHARGYLGLGGLNFVSHDFEETLDRIESYGYIPSQRTSRFGVDAIAVGSMFKPWHILAEQPTYTTDALAQQVIDTHYQHAESITTEDVVTDITPTLAHVRVQDGESLMTTDWVTAHDFAVATDIINRRSNSGLENRGATFYTALVRHLVASETTRYQDAVSFMSLLESVYGVSFKTTSSTHLHDRFFDESRSQIVIARDALSEITEAGNTDHIDGLGGKGFQILQAIVEETMHLRQRKF